jgi:hypothetical protein
MLAPLLSTVVTAAIAATAALFGVWRLAGFDGDWQLVGWVVCASVALWLALGQLYSRSDIAPVQAIYFGLLSPLLGCLIVAPPWSFFVVFARPGFSLGLGLATSLAVCVVSRVLATE